MAQATTAGLMYKFYRDIKEPTNQISYSKDAF